MELLEAVSTPRLVDYSRLSFRESSGSHQLNKQLDLSSKGYGREDMAKIEPLLAREWLSSSSPLATVCR